MRAESFASEFVPKDVVAFGFGGVVFGVNDILDGSVIGNTKVDFGGTSFGDGEAGGASVGDFASCDVVDNDIKFDVFDFDGLIFWRRDR